MLSADLTATYLGFDYGECRIGIATGQRASCSASPLTTLTAIENKPNWAQIGKIIDEWAPCGLIVGVPVQMDGSDSRITEAAKRFGRRLNGRFGIPVFYADERLSSAEAREILKSARIKGKRGKTQKGDDDRIAAALILQHWLETFDGNG